MGTKPVFQNKFEVNIWKKLDADPDVVNKKGDYYIELAEEIISYNGTVSSPILVRLIEFLYNTKSEGMYTLIEQLTQKHRLNECSPSLTAAQLFLRMDNIKKAGELVNGVKGGGDIPFLCCVRAKIYIAGGDMVSARRELMRARCSNPLYPMFYDLIQQIEPTQGWMYRRNIELLVAGEEPIPCGNVGDPTGPEILYGIYLDWYRGNKDDASRKMINSKEYSGKNPEYILASARMSMDEHDWHSAQMMYETLLSMSSNCVYIICEAANSHYRGGDYEGALSLYRDAEALDPSSPSVMKGLIYTYSSLGKKDEALQCMQEFLDTENAYYTSYINGIRILIDSEMYSEASSLINKVLISYPKDPEVNVLRSEIELVKGHLNSALEIISDVVRSNPDDPDCRVQKARVLVKMLKPDRAEKELERALEINPEHLSALLLMLELKVPDAKASVIIDLCGRILDIDPSSVVAMNAMSKAKLAQGDIDGSYNSYKDAVLADYRPENFINVLYTLMNEGKYREVLDFCFEKDREFGKNATVRRLKGNAEFALGEYLRASSSFASAAVLEPDNPIIWHSKGMADEAAGDLDSAEEAYNRAVLMNLNEPEFWVSRGCIQEKRGDLKGAVESFNRSIELKPDEVYPLVRKAMIFAKLGRFEEAMYLVDMAIMTDQDNQSLYKVQREICIAGGFYERVVELCLMVLEKDRLNTYAISDLVKTYILMDDKEKAIETVDSALTKSPKSMPILMIRKDMFSTLGDNAGIVDTCERILRVDPGNHQIRMELAETYALIGDMASANRLYSEMQYDSMEAVDGARSGSDRVSKPDASAEIRDDSALYKIALALFETGDYAGSRRTIDRAISMDPTNKDYILLKTNIYSKTGDNRSAEAFLSDILKKGGGNGDLWEKDGDLKLILNDPHGALICYDKAVGCGKQTSSLHMKRGKLQEKDGRYEEAFNSYSSAAIKDRSNAEAFRCMALVQLKMGNLTGAIKSIETTVSTTPSAISLAVRAKVYHAVGDRDEVMKTYESFLRTKDQDKESTDMMVEALEDAGFTKESEALKKHKQSAPKVRNADRESGVPVKVKRYSERVLRRAYTSKMSLSDPDLISALDLDRNTATAVMEYLSDMHEYGDILPGTPDFDRMEKLSLNVISKGNCDDIDNDPVISIPCAYVAGNTKDADEAKLLVAYIYKVMTSKVDKSAITDPTWRAAKDLKKGMTTAEIMKTLNIGAYQAKALRDQL